MKKIGLTGGIGSGKTTVAKIFQSMGYQIYFADDRAKAILQDNPEVRNKVIQLFGQDIYLPDGSIDKRKMSSIVFRDEKKLAALNSIVHPAVRKDYDTWHEAIEASDYKLPFTLKEAAILFESGAANGLNGVIVVTAPAEVRIARVISRDQLSREQVVQRMKNQMPERERVRLAGFLIDNDGEQMLIPQVLAAIQHYAPNES